MSVRYRRLTIEYEPEFGGVDGGTSVFDPTWEQQQHPVFLAFMCWLYGETLAAMTAAEAALEPIPDGGQKRIPF